MDKTQFILSIVANIATHIIILLYRRGTLGAKNLLTKRTIKAKLRKIFSVKRITALGSLLAALFNLWILVKFVAGRSSFTRLEFFAGITFSLIAFHWGNRFVAGLLSTTERRLEETQQHLEQAQARIAEIEEQQRSRSLSQEQRSRLLELLRSKPLGKMTVAPLNGDAEASDFASEIIEVMRKAKWEVSLESISLGALMPKGLVFQYFQTLAEEIPAEEIPEEIPGDVIVLRQALAEIGLTTGEDRVLECPAKLLKRMTEEPYGAATLIVGRKS